VVLENDTILQHWVLFAEVADVPELHESDGMMMVTGEAWVDC
jgi:hypothetical protein